MGSVDQFGLEKTIKFGTLEKSKRSTNVSIGSAQVHIVRSRPRIYVVGPWGVPKSLDRHTYSEFHRISGRWREAWVLLVSPKGRPRALQALSKFLRRSSKSRAKKSSNGSPTILRRFSKVRPSVLESSPKASPKASRWSSKEFLRAFQGSSKGPPKGPPKGTPRFPKRTASGASRLEGEP